MTQKWPDSPEFRSFAAKLADAVTQHINNGGSITTSHAQRNYDCRCPLGCLNPSTRDFRRFPWSGIQLYRRPLTEAQFDAFVDGFERSLGSAADYTEPAYFRLGRAYRERFP